MKKVIMFLIVLSFVSCEDLKKESRSDAEGLFVIWFETLFRSSDYDPACDNESLSTPLTLSSPVLSTSVRKKYRFTTGPSGLKYNFSVSSSYPTTPCTTVQFEVIP